MMHVLFVTWDSGATDYLSSLFFPIFAALRPHGVRVYTLQGTYGAAADVERVRMSAAEWGVDYVPFVVPPENRGRRMPLHLQGFARTIVEEAKRVHADVVMPRAIVPAAACLSVLPWLRGRNVVWDADGLPADERVDFAGWSRHGLRYWSMRSVETAMLRVADRVMVRTEAAAEILQRRAGWGFSRNRLVVVPNGRDAGLYKRSDAARREIRDHLGVPENVPLIISVGTQAPQYGPELQAGLVRMALKAWPHAHAVFLTAQDAVIREALDREGVSASRYTIQRVPAMDVPRWLSAGDVGLALREASFSQRAVSPLKIGEYLLSGLPVVATSGVGDVDCILESDVALLSPTMELPSQEHFVRWLTERLAQREATAETARAVGLAHFSQKVTVEGYLRLLRRRPA